MAGLDVRWGLDMAVDPCQTFAMNFPGAELCQEWAHHFVGRARKGPKGQYRVDLLHLSPPCQMWCRVKTRPGCNDEQNLASLFAVRDLMDTATPRLATLEQTFGLLDRRFRPFFHALVGQMTDLGFSVSWQGVKLQEYGLAQSRRRLIMVASCPGEPLPDFPPPTHGEPPVLPPIQPFTTPRSVLQRIPAAAANHDVRRAVAHAHHAHRTPWDATTITRCITCAGGENCCYPDGSRALTHREFAALQSFPLHHVFHGHAIRRQIGNAVPPLFAQALFTAMRQHLERVDGRRRRRRTSRRTNRGTTSSTAIIIDLTGERD